MGLLLSVFQPNPSLSYGFIASAYAILGVVGMALYVAQTQGVHGTEGLWIVCSPVALGLLWAVAMRARQKKMLAAEGAAGAAPSAEGKKDD
jgi:hypothetical protein